MKFDEDYRLNLEEKISTLCGEHIEVELKIELLDIKFDCFSSDGFVRSSPYYTIYDLPPDIDWLADFIYFDLRWDRMLDVSQKAKSAILSGKFSNWYDNLSDRNMKALHEYLSETEYGRLYEKLLSKSVGHKLSWVITFACLCFYRKVAYPLRMKTRKMMERLGYERQSHQNQK